MRMEVVKGEVLGNPVLVSDGATRSPEEAHRGLPMHPVVTVARCVDARSLVTLSISKGEGGMSDAHRELLRSVVESIRKQ